MKSIHAIIHLIVVGFIGITLPTQAAIIASYDFSADLSANIFDPNVTANDFVASAGIAGGRSGFNQNLFERTNQTTSTDLTTAVANNEFFSFTVDVNPGAVLDLTSLSVDLGYSRVLGLPTDQLTIEVLSSIDGFTDADSIGSLTSITTNTGQNILQNLTVDLSGPDFQNLTTPIEFRFYLYDDANDNDTIHRIDNVVLNGTAIPEPSTLTLLLGASLTMLIGFRRKRMNS